MYLAFRSVRLQRYEKILRYSLQFTKKEVTVQKD